MSDQDGEKDALLPPSRFDQTDFPTEKISGKRRHSAKLPSRHGSFRSKKLRQEHSLGDIGHITHSPVFRHKQQPGISPTAPPLPLWNRLRNFGHHDLQSASLERLGSSEKDAESDRAMRKKPTGASAAHTTSSDTGVEKRENDLVASCPAFRNEVGGDCDWGSDKDNPLLKLRGSLSLDKQKRVGSRAKMILEGSVPSKDIMQHKTAMGRQMRIVLQPQTSVQCPFEFIDYGALYYRNHFYQQDHQNFFGVDDSVGPVAVSLKREKVADDFVNFFEASSTLLSPQTPVPKHLYRVIIRTSSLEPLRGTVLEDSIPSRTKAGTNKGLPPRDVLECLCQGELHLSCLKLGKPEKKVCQELMRLDEQELNNMYKIGVLYCKSGQTSEEDMYNNEHGSPAFEEFLQTIGRKVTMKGFTKYRAQLDHKTDTTGTYSIYTDHHDAEIMFHVSTYLPFTPSNFQQLLRKRHIGNDIVTVIFQEPGCEPFSPKVIQSHFQHIFVVVRVENPCTDYTKYRVAVTRSQDVPYFGPSILEGGVFDRNEQFKEFFLTKLINACNASLRSEKFATMATRTRRQYLLDLCESSCSNLSIDQATSSGIVAGLLSKNWGSRKREKPHLEVPVIFTPGALVWNVSILMKKGKPLPFTEDADTVLDCGLVLAPDLLMFVYTNTQENLLHIPMRDISGWIQDGKRINLFYDGSFCLSLEVYEQDDIHDIITRLQTLAPCVSASHEAIQMKFQRASTGLLGFSINEAGEVQKVDGLAKANGLRIKSKILQVENKLVCTHKHSHITDIFTDRAKSVVKALVIPPAPNSYRELMYYPSVNWAAVWLNRPSHAFNGELDEQSQNGMDQMELVEIGDTIMVNPKKSAQNADSKEGMEVEDPEMDDKEPIYDRLRAENQSMQSNSYGRRSRSPTASRRYLDDNAGFTRMRIRNTTGRDHVPAQQIAENIRASERARSTGPSPELLEHRLDVYTSHVPTHISTSSFLPNSQPHTTAPLSSLRRSGRSERPTLDISSPKSPNREYPPTPGSVHELAKKFSFSPPQSNKTSPSRIPNTAGSGAGKSPVKSAIVTAEMARGGIPVPSRTAPPPPFSKYPSPSSTKQYEKVQLRDHTSSKVRPASCDASLISIEKDTMGEGKMESQRGERERERRLNRLHTAQQLPVRRQVSPYSDHESAVTEKSEDREEGILEENISQEIRQRRISVRERTQKWEARGSEIPSFFTLPKSFRSKERGVIMGGVLSPTSQNSTGGSRIPSPHSLTQSQKFSSRGMYSKQSTPPIQEETDFAEEDEEKEKEEAEKLLAKSRDRDARNERNREMFERTAAADKSRAAGSVEVRLGSPLGHSQPGAYSRSTKGSAAAGVGVRQLGSSGIGGGSRGGGGYPSSSFSGIRPPNAVSGLKTPSSSSTQSQVHGYGNRDKAGSPTRPVSPQQKTGVHSRHSTSPVERSSSSSKIPVTIRKAPGGTEGGGRQRKFSPPTNVLRSPPHTGSSSQFSRGGPSQKLSAKQAPHQESIPLDTVVLESSLHPLNLTDGPNMSKESSNRKVEEWLRRSSEDASSNRDGLGSSHNSLTQSDNSEIDQLRHKVESLEVQLRQETKSKMELQTKLSKVERHMRDQWKTPSSRSTLKTAMI